MSGSGHRSTSAPEVGNWPWWHDGNRLPSQVQSITEGGITRYPVEFPVNVGAYPFAVFVRASDVDVVREAQWEEPAAHAQHMSDVVRKFGTRLVFKSGYVCEVERPLVEVVALLWPHLAGEVPT